MSSNQSDQAPGHNETYAIILIGRPRWGIHELISQEQRVAELVQRRAKEESHA